MNFLKCQSGSSVAEEKSLSH